jgi:hypothetical protein
MRPVCSCPSHQWYDFWSQSKRFTKFRVDFTALGWTKVEQLSWLSSPQSVTTSASSQKSGGDKNAIALPETLVETGVTQPYENDFNLCTHAVIKGTVPAAATTCFQASQLFRSDGTPNSLMLYIKRRPCSNATVFSTTGTQTLIYEHSYQYIRATTPVSIFPAVYYAHIAPLRAGDPIDG